MAGGLPESYLAQVRTSPLGDRKWFIQRRGIDILLHCRPSVIVDLAQYIAQGWEIHASLRRLGEDTGVNGLGERNLFAFGLLPYLSINTLQVQVGDTLVMAAYKVHRVAAAPIGKMTGIEAQ